MLGESCVLENFQSTFRWTHLKYQSSLCENWPFLRHMIIVGTLTGIWRNTYVYQVTNRYRYLVKLLSAENLYGHSMSLSYRASISLSPFLSFFFWFK